MVTELPFGGLFSCSPGPPEVGPAPEVAGSWRSRGLCGGALCCGHAKPAETANSPIPKNVDRPIVDRRACSAIVASTDKLTPSPGITLTPGSELRALRELPGGSLVRGENSTEGDG